MAEAVLCSPEIWTRGSHLGKAIVERTEPGRARGARWTKGGVTFPSERGRQTTSNVAAVRHDEVGRPARRWHLTFGLTPHQLRGWGGARPTKLGPGLGTRPRAGLEHHPLARSRRRGPSDRSPSDDIQSACGYVLSGPVLLGVCGGIVESGMRDDRPQADPFVRPRARARVDGRCDDDRTRTKPPLTSASSAAIQRTGPRCEERGGHSLIPPSRRRRSTSAHESDRPDVRPRRTQRLAKRELSIPSGAPWMATHVGRAVVRQDCFAWLAQRPRH
jgi:hypothetical protein